MTMTTFSFLLYFLPVMLIGYYALFFSRKAQNLWLVVCGIAFFLINNYMSLLYLLLGLVVMNNLFGYAIQRYKDTDRKTKRLVTFACLANLLPLLALKYLEPAFSGIAGLFGLSSPAFPVAPLGISFLALQGISYVVDIHRGTVRWHYDFVATSLYFSFFPPLQAGPIIRYHDVAAQIAQREMRFDNIVQGLCRFIVGLGKVILIARPVMSITEIIFNQSNMSGIYTTVPVTLALLGLLTCMLGIYHYFSGYSDLVTGLARMLGFTLPENFAHPVLASSVTNFWTRCYASLTAWFDEYVYQPLGKNRSNSDKTVLHTLLMWLLIGVWLGFGLPKIILGVWSALFIIAERIIDVNDKKRSLWRQIAVLIYMLIAAIAFQTDTMYHFTLFISNLFGMSRSGFYSSFAALLVRENWIPLAVGILCCFPIGARLRQYSQEHRNALSGIISLAYPLAMILVVALVALSLSGTSYDPYQIIYSYLWS